jgi:hypothetical protein
MVVQKESGEDVVIKNRSRQQQDIIQQLAPPADIAEIQFSFYSDYLSKDHLISNVYNIPHDGKVRVSVAAMVVGNSSAENVTIWFRVCTLCAWSAAPPGFVSTPEKPLDRSISASEMLPNVSSPRWDLEIDLPKYPASDKTYIAAYYACKNCAPVDWAHPQTLWINQPNPFMRLQMLSPSTSYRPTQEPQ